MRDSVERRLSVLEEKKGNAAWHNPRTPEQNELARRYWDSLIHTRKVSKKLEQAYTKIPRLRCSEGTNEVIGRIADGILGRREGGKPEKDVRRDQVKRHTPVKTELHPMENAQNRPRTIRVRTLPV